MPSKNMQQFIPISTTIETVWNGNTTRRLYNGSWESMLSTRSWANTPGFKSKRLRANKLVPADLPMNNYTDIHRLTDGPGQLNVRLIPDYWYPGNYHKVTGQHDISRQIFLDVDGALHRSVLFNAAIAELPSKMNGNSFNLPLFLGELNKSVTMVKDLAHELAQFFTLFSKGQRKFFTTRELDGIYLEYRYGWRLLVKDIVDALISIDDAMGRGVLQKAKSSARSSSRGSGLIGNYWISDPNLGLAADIREVYERRDEVTITLYYSDDHTWTGKLQQFGITNPFVLLWEFTRLSFMVDWVIGVGDYLSSLDAFLGKTFRKGCVSYKSTQKTTWSLENLKGLGFDRPQVTVLERPTQSGVSTTYKREALGSFPSAALPTIAPNLNINRALDAIGIMKQSFVPRCRGYIVKVGKY